MCGVFGGVSDGPGLREKVLEGCRFLEYRGYDSAGIAWRDEQGEHVVKVVGDCLALSRLLPKTDSAQVALGHTRWATHGVPAVENAHPMQGERLTLVHNGILENFSILKDELLALGYAFASQTDTEVLLRFMEHHALGHPQQAVTSWLPGVLELLTGEWAIVWMDREDPQALYAYADGRQLVVGQSAESAWVGSDWMSLLLYADRCQFVPEKTLVRLDQHGIQCWNGRAFEPLALAAQSARAMHSIEHIREDAMWHEMHEQPDRLCAQEAAYAANPSWCAPWRAALEQASEIILVGCGSSYYAAMLAKYVWEARFKKRVSVEMASEFAVRSPFLHPGSMVIFLSQSGETADVLSAMRWVRHQNLALFVLCNVEYSTAAKQADFFLPLLAGPEWAVASTKAFAAQVFAILYLASSPQELEELPGLWTLMRRQLEDSSVIGLAERLSQHPHILFIARDRLWPVACEAALKFKELTYRAAESYPAGELKHGPLAIVDATIPTLVLMDDVLRPQMSHAIQEISARKGPVIVLDGGENPLQDAWMSWPAWKIQYWQALAMLIPMQRLAYHASRALGYNPNRPRNLAKSVTVG